MFKWLRKLFCTCAEEQYDNGRRWVREEVAKNNNKATEELLDKLSDQCHSSFDFGPFDRGALDEIKEYRSK